MATDKNKNKPKRKRKIIPAPPGSAQSVFNVKPSDDYVPRRRGNTTDGAGNNTRKEIFKKPNNDSSTE